LTAADIDGREVVDGLGWLDFLVYVGYAESVMEAKAKAGTI
jgi:hypothetical protein